MNSIFIIFAAFFVVSVAAQNAYPFCAEDKDCKEGQYCVKFQFAGLCSDYQDEGKTCNDEIKCKPGLQCLDDANSIFSKTCQVPPPPTVS